MFHGWNDQLISPRNSINYYQNVVDAVGGAGKAADSVRLYMVPGMNHCRGGDGPNSFDMVTALERWVEQREAPVRITAEQVITVLRRSRPLCPYPQIAKYSGAGSVNDAASFTCVVP